MTAAPSLVLVLGDQLTPDRGALCGARAGVDTIVMAEVRDEATYVRHNKLKIALVFSAMRHFCAEMRKLGFAVIYFQYQDGKLSLREAVASALQVCDANEVRVCEPGEYRLLADIESWRLPVPVAIVPDDRFFCSRQAFTAWARGRKQLRMEHFYRQMRRRHKLLVDHRGEPAGGKWKQPRCRARATGLRTG